MTANGNHVMMGFLNHFILHVDTHKADLAGANSLGPLMGRSRSEDKRSGTATLKHNDSASLAECVCVSFVRLYEIHHHQYAKQDKDNENPMIFNFSNFYLKTFEKNNFFWVALIHKKTTHLSFCNKGCPGRTRTMQRATLTLMYPGRTIRPMLTTMMTNS